MDYDEAVLQITSQIPRGRVTTYGEIAKALGGIGYSRAVGNALNRNKRPVEIPCHRVVKSGGGIGGYSGGVEKKIKLLASEGVSVENGRVTDFEKILFNHSEMRRP